MIALSKEGLVVKRMYLPRRLKVELEHLDGTRWRLHYIESFDETMSQEAFNNTMKIGKGLGVPVKGRKRTLYYTIEGSQDQVWGVILAEAIGMTRVGDLTLREMLALVAVGFSRVRSLEAEKR